jgi:ATP-dependent helicase/nuclease subunit A
MNLTDEQKLAAHADGSIAVTAGAGTGKTAMLAERYLHHVLVDGLSPLSIVAVTFTEKAADELRSRIRSRLDSELDNERLIAEIDAAQISTIHSLAKRICDDFYDIAAPDGGIPADFTILDDLDSPIWLAGQFERAMGEIDPEIVKELGYVWLSNALRELYKDPIAAESALSKGPEDWQIAIEQAKRSELGKAMSDPDWNEARSVFQTYSGDDDDKLEISRKLLLIAIKDIEAGENLDGAVAAISAQRANAGRAPAWPPGGKDAVIEALKKLKALISKPAALFKCALSTADDEMYRRQLLLKTAFEQFSRSLMDAKRREKVLDFNDLEAYALAALRHDGGEALVHYSLRWQAFLVDEFQDTNPVQAELLELLTNGKRLTVVGDEKQAIYGFRGADVEVFARFRDRIKTEYSGEEVSLTRSFRTHGPLVAETNQLFKPVLREIFQGLEADHEKEEHLGAPYISFHQVEEPKGSLKPERAVIEARFIATKIAELVENSAVIYDRKGRARGPRPLEYRDFAVLSRTWKPLIHLADILSASGVPAVLESGGNLLETQEAIDATSLLDFLSEPDDGIPLVAILRSPFFSVSDIRLQAAAGKVNKETTWWKVVQTEPDLAKEFDLLRALLEKRKLLSAEEILRFADRMTGYSAISANLPQGARRLADWKGMLEFLRKIERTGHGDVFSASRHIRQLIDAEVEVPRPHMEVGNAVSLMTIHSAKGLEWPVVFVADLARKGSSNTGRLAIDRNVGLGFAIEEDDYQKIEPGILGFLKYRRKQREDEETRRILYVAVTRARDRVFLTAAGEKNGEIEILRPGLDAANTPIETLPFDPVGVVLPAPALPEIPPLPPAFQPHPVSEGPEVVTATGLTAYARCPLQFKFREVDGHPGSGEGSRSAMRIGLMTHSALELGMTEAAELEMIFPAATPEQIFDALQCAAAFGEHEAFTRFRGMDAKAEVPFAVEINGTRLIGKADLEGEDFVLDFKTDAEPDPEEHRFQLWAYSYALDKPRAYVAYLREPQLVEFNENRLSAIRDEAFSMLDKIRSADFAPTPSLKTCGHCHYSRICASSMAPDKAS